MISKEEHHLFMESLRQTLPHHSFANLIKSLREPPSCDDGEDDADFDKILAEIFESLSESDLDSQCDTAEGNNT